MSGVDPDSVFTKLSNLANKSHDTISKMPFQRGYDTVRGKGPQLEFEDLADEHRLETFNVFNTELEKMRTEDPDAFTAAYEFLPLQDRVGYLYGVKQAGGITDEQYKSLYISEYNQSAVESGDPTAPRFVEVSDKVYLYKPWGDPREGSDRPLDVKRDLYEVPLDLGVANPSAAQTGRFLNDLGHFTPIGGGTDDFDDSAWDFFDPIVSAVQVGLVVFGGVPGAVIAAKIGAGYTAAKGVSGETLHVSDWLRAAPYAVNEINAALTEMD